jgi:NAD(P)-dependent dehydrogenase (short-subunit alcohol dehydrogenase family)
MELDEGDLNYYYDKKFFLNKNIIVTGATGGIGSCLVRTLTKLGAKIVAIIKDEDKFNNMFNDILNEKNLSYEKIDFSKNLQQKEEYQKAILKLDGKIDILFLCHGKYNMSEIEATSYKEFDEILNINTRSYTSLISLSVPFLKLSKGNIVAVSSLESYIPIASGFLNTVTKSMVNELIQCSALELASFGIRVNGVAPGITFTSHRVGINEDFQEDQNREYMEKMGTYNLLGENKVVQPTDIVNSMLFLASEDAKFITGEIIKVDNGFSLNHDLNFSKLD